MPQLYAAALLDFKPLASSHGCTRNGATDAVMLSESRTDLELPAMKQPSEA